MKSKQTKLIKIRTEPKKPVRLPTKEYRMAAITCSSLELVVAWADHLGASYSEVSIDVDTNYAYPCDSEVYASFVGLESDGDWAARLTSYETKKKSYDSWYAKNKRLIEKELCRRKEIDDQKETKRKELDRLRLQRKLVKIEKALKKLEK